MRYSRGYWTKDKCFELALKYNHRIDFMKNDIKAYNYARKNNFLDEICSHMEIIGNRFKRCIYSFEFSDNSVYIGLTHDFNKRILEHKNLKKSTVYKKIKDSNLTPTIKKLTDYIDKNDTSIKEIEYIKEYKNSGWIILNIKKGGGLGGDYIKWTKEKCHEISLKYNIKKRFEEENRSCYESARRQGILDEICSHMEVIKKPDGYWTLEKCILESKKYKNTTEFREKSRGCYETARQNGYIKDIYSTMKKEKYIRKWTIEKCMEELLKYGSFSELKKYNKSCFNQSYSNGYVSEMRELLKNNKIKND